MRSVSALRKWKHFSDYDPTWHEFTVSIESQSHSFIHQKAMRIVQTHDWFRFEFGIQLSPMDLNLMISWCNSNAILNDVMAIDISVTATQNRSLIHIYRRFHFQWWTRSHMQSVTTLCFLNECMHSKCSAYWYRVTETD